MKSLCLLTRWSGAGILQGAGISFQYFIFAEIAEFEISSEPEFPSIFSFRRRDVISSPRHRDVCKSLALVISSQRRDFFKHGLNNSSRINI